MKHLIVKPKTTFERFSPHKPSKGLRIILSHKTHMCDGSKRGLKYKHPPVAMHRSGTAPSGVGVRIQRWECPVCGMKTTYGRSG